MSTDDILNIILMEELDVRPSDLEKIKKQFPNLLTAMQRAYNYGTNYLL